MIFIVLSRKLANSKKFVTKKIITYLIAVFVLLAQYIFTHSIGFEIYKITVMRIANAYTHGVGLQIRTNVTNGCYDATVSDQ